MFIMEQLTFSLRNAAKNGNIISYTISLKCLYFVWCIVLFPPAPGPIAWTLDMDGFIRFRWVRRSRLRFQVLMGTLQRNPTSYFTFRFFPVCYHSVCQQCSFLILSCVCWYRKTNTTIKMKFKKDINNFISSVAASLIRCSLQSCHWEQQDRDVLTGVEGFGPPAFRTRTARSQHKLLYSSISSRSPVICRLFVM